MALLGKDGDVGGRGRWLQGEGAMDPTQEEEEEGKQVGGEAWSVPPINDQPQGKANKERAARRHRHQGEFGPGDAGG